MTIARASDPTPLTAAFAICWRGSGRIDVLVIDDWAMAPLSEPERRDFWEIREDLSQVRSTILTSQAPVPRQHEQIGDPTLADCFLDGLVKRPTDYRRTLVIARRAGAALPV